ncbi:MAG: hypothetical protein KAQ85_06585 [Thermodesulfovibrionia bacterium]|nr:hypothetical protein [Thermodesulfovibrionia bacterium]
MTYKEKIRRIRQESKRYNRNVSSMIIANGSGTFLRTIGPALVLRKKGNCYVVDDKLSFQEA